MTPLVKSCKEILTAQEVCSVFYGLQLMNSDCSEVIELLRELPQLVKTCIEPLTAQKLGMMLNSLQGMKSDCYVDRVKSISQDMY